MYIVHPSDTTAQPFPLDGLYDIDRGERVGHSTRRRRDRHCHLPTSERESESQRVGELDREREREREKRDHKAAMRVAE
jgi:hypothetical protein